MSAKCAYLRKYCKLFCTNLWTDFEISRIFGPAPQIGHIEMFFITLVETISNVFSRYI